jgi:hypothetical protein
MMDKMKSGGMAKNGKKADFMKMIADKKKTAGKAMPAKKMAKGGSTDGCAVRGKTKGTMVKMAMGGKAKKAC